MKMSSTAFCPCALAVLVGSGSLFAHTDDPKQWTRAPAYTGPGYLASIDGPQSATGFPASGVTLNAWFTMDDFDGSHSSANDCWGYVSPSGREYALLGLRGGTGVVDITDPDSSFIVGTVLGTSSLWGDVKIYEHPKLGGFAYKVTEDDAIGIQVIDLRDVDAGEVCEINRIDENDNGRSHNVVVDTDSGFLYRVGGSYYGMAVYDLNVDPINPPRVGTWSDRYIHDAQVVTHTSGPYAGRQIAYTCGGDNGGGTNTGLEILDVTDKSNIVSVSRLLYEGGDYSHQAWLSADRQYLYLNDEGDEGEFGIPTNTKIIDVSNINSPSEEPAFTNGQPSIGHNLYMRGDFIFEANYSSGMRVFDATDRLNPVEVAYFDTWPEDDVVDYVGLWSCFPFFPSGRVIGSDRQRGLFVWTVDAIVVCNDLDGSGTIDFGDILVVLSAWGNAGGPEDLNGDGTVEFGDILVLLGDWGSACP